MFPNVTIDDLAPQNSWDMDIVNTAFRHLRFRSLSETEKQETETYSQVDEPVELQVNTWLHLAAILGQSVSIEHCIYVSFDSIEQVQSVYVQSLDKVYNAFVFLRQDNYDEELMDCLLDRESEVLDSYQDTMFNFHYLPLLSNTPEQSIPENATLIFSR